MGTGKHNNTVFYDGYEGEGEIILSMSNPDYATSIHIWDGYFEKIFGNPAISETGWTGFTKDYQESVRTFNGEECISLSDISEYIFDLRNYADQTFSYSEARDCLKLLIHFFEDALRLSSEVIVTIR